MVARVIFLLLLGCALSPWASPPLALVAGLAFGIAFSHPFPAEAKRWTKTLLQSSVVGLGFGMNLHQVLQAGSEGLLYTACGIGFSMLIGLGLGRLLRVGSTAAYLIAVGTAICGGSAIAAVGPIIGADPEEMSVSLGTVFLLNSVALLAFPAIGKSMGLSQGQFGLWAALAIHDTSSVVGAAVKYGAAALAVGTTVKLARALWIVPVSLVTAALRRPKRRTERREEVVAPSGRNPRTETRIHWPWFILFFALAAALNSCVPAGAAAYIRLYAWAKAGLTATLFLIGSGISTSTLRKVGVRPLLQGLLLWLIVASTSLCLIRSGTIR